MSKLRLLPITTAEILERIKRGQCFSTSRFGDGEWRAIMGRYMRGERNCDGHRFCPELGHKLAAVLQRRPPYWLGMQSYALRLLGPGLEDLLERRQLLGLAWYNADTLAFHDASRAGKMLRVVEVLRHVPTIMVGPLHLRPFAEKNILPEEFIQVPPRDAYWALSRIEKAVSDAYYRARKPVVISISCGMPAGLLVDRLYPQMPEAFLLDTGSVWDHYAGVDSRRYMLRMTREGNHGSLVTADLADGAIRGDPAV